MRIIKRTSAFDQSLTFIVQEESWNGASAYQNSLLPTTKIFGKVYQDIRGFRTLEEARAFAHQYVNNLQPGEEIVG